MYFQIEVHLLDNIGEILQTPQYDEIAFDVQFPLVKTYKVSTKKLKLYLRNLLTKTIVM